MRLRVAPLTDAVFLTAGTILLLLGWTDWGFHPGYVLLGMVLGDLMNRSIR